MLGPSRPPCRYRPRMNGRLRRRRRSRRRPGRPAHLQDFEAVEKRAQHSPDRRGHEEQPQLRKGLPADKHRRAKGAGRIDRHASDLNADDVDHGQGDADAQTDKARPGIGAGSQYFDPGPWRRRPRCSTG